MLSLSLSLSLSLPLPPSLPPSPHPLLPPLPLAVSNLTPKTITQKHVSATFSFTGYTTGQKSGLCPFAAGWKKRCFGDKPYWMMLNIIVGLPFVEICELSRDFKGRKRISPNWSTAEISTHAYALTRHRDMHAHTHSNTYTSTCMHTHKLRSLCVSVNVAYKHTCIQHQDAHMHSLLLPPPPTKCSHTLNLPPSHSYMHKSVCHRYCRKNMSQSTIFRVWKRRIHKAYMLSSFLLLLRSQLYLRGSPFLVRFLRMWLFFNPTIEVVAFCLGGWCMLGVFLLPTFTHLEHEVRIFCVCAMECVCAQIGPRFILSLERVLGEWRQKPC